MYGLTFFSPESIAQSASEDLKNNSDVLANLKEVKIIFTFLHLCVRLSICLFEI